MRQNVERQFEGIERGSFYFINPIYQPSLSTSFSSISCDTPQCCSLDIFACRNNSCLYQVSFGDDSYTFGDGSFTVGDCISETLTFNDAASVDNIAIGCGHNIEGLSVGAAGVYKGVTTSQLDELAAETAAAMTASHPDYASLAWVGVGGEVVPVAEAAVGSGGGGVIVDLGTAVTRLETAVYEAVRDRFRRVLGVAGGGRGSVVRHVLRSESAGEREPADVGLAFRWGKSVKLPARNYLVLKVPAINMSIILK
ncbi:hypothetical protein Scep_017084 [Stephania cephalantha]|uniref:Peptidase A1 domain-containing protein n=1 Tax=Stephania cephalantha TaxID=152367 RepID=A0AAP0NWJ9_9MAGN